MHTSLFNITVRSHPRIVLKVSLFRIPISKNITKHVLNLLKYQNKKKIQKTDSPSEIASIFKYTHFLCFSVSYAHTHRITLVQLTPLHL